MKKIVFVLIILSLLLLSCVPLPTTTGDSSSTGSSDPPSNSETNNPPEIVWQKNLGGSSWDIAFANQQTSDGGYIVAGFTESNDGDVNGNHGGRDYWIVKLDSNGNMIWQKAFGGSGDDHASSIQQTSDGDYIVTGTTGSNDGDVIENYGLTDYWIVKLGK